MESKARMKAYTVKTGFLVFLAGFFLPVFAGAVEITVTAPQAEHLAFASADTSQSHPLILEECYALALKQSEVVAIDIEKIKQAEAHFLQALGTLLPQVSLSRTETRQDTELSSSSDSSFEQKAVFKQVLFSGFKEFAGMSGSQLEKKQRLHEKRRAEQLLFVDVSEAFYLLLEIREDLRILGITRTALTERISELKTRENLGKSRASEIASTQTQLYSLEDQIESVKSQEKIARELLAFLVGTPIDEIADVSNSEQVLKAETDYTARAVSRDDVLAADYAHRLYQKNVLVAKSGFFPQVSLETSYYNHRTSSPTDSAWTALLTVTVPVFQGTTTYGQVKEARSLERQSELTLRRTARGAAQDIHDAYVIAQAAAVRVGLLKKALESAELSYGLQKQDYTLSLVSNLDVLAALQNLQSVRRNYNHIVFESKRAYVQLRVAAGEIVETSR